MNICKPAGIAFFIDQNIVALLCPEAVQPDLHRAVVVIEFDIEERRRIDAPHHRAVGFLDEIVEIFPGRPVSHADCKILRTLDVGTPGFKPVVGRMPGAAEPEVVVLGGEFVAVEDDFGLAAVARAAPEQFVLAAFAEFSHVGESAVRRGHAGIILLDAPAHLLDQRFLQGGGVAKQAFRIVVLRLQIFADVRVQDGGVAQHILPVFVLQPGVIVDDGDAVGRKGIRSARRDRRRQGADFVHRALHQVLRGRPVAQIISGFGMRIARYATPAPEVPDRLLIVGLYG